MAKRLIVANWKMNPPTFAEAKEIAEATKKAAARAPGVSVVICPPVIYLRELAKNSRGGVSFGVQDIFYEERGAYTGEISSFMVKNAGADFAIIGHSERRERGEASAVIAKKVAAALDAKLAPVLCIGERARDALGEYLSVVRTQLTEGLADIPPGAIAKVAIAYEPVWAIGKKAQDAIAPRDLHEMAIFIRKVLTERLERAKALKVTILYGGAVESDNAHRLLHDGDVDGFLVGHASLDKKDFPLIIRAVAS